MPNVVSEDLKKVLLLSIPGITCFSASCPVAYEYCDRWCCRIHPVQRFKTPKTVFEDLRRSAEFKKWLLQTSGGESWWPPEEASVGFQKSSLKHADEFPGNLLGKNYWDTCSKVVIGLLIKKLLKTFSKDFLQHPEKTLKDFQKSSLQTLRSGCCKVLELVIVDSKKRLRRLSKELIETFRRICSSSAGHPQKSLLDTVSDKS